VQSGQRALHEPISFQELQDRKSRLAHAVAEGD
jgi:hypothetical protein